MHASVAAAGLLVGILADAVAVAPGDRLSQTLPERSVWVKVPAQTCQVGCTPQDSECSDNERPQHQAQLPRGFSLMATEVTVDAFRGFADAVNQPMAQQPDWSGGDHPVVNVTWSQASAYCQWAKGRLPTEAEWECAARGGEQGHIYPWGDRYEPGQANDSDGFRQAGTKRVGSYAPNTYGLYDMVGNVWEWVSDWFDDGYYAHAPLVNPQGPLSGQARVMRGGSWRPFPRVLRTSNRGRSQPDRTNYYVGFRCARDP
jgi:formylglycine-generating enzyme required for sulfatase activity